MPWWNESRRKRSGAPTGADAIIASVPERKGGACGTVPLGGWGRYGSGGLLVSGGAKPTRWGNCAGARLSSVRDAGLKKEAVSDQSDPATKRGIRVRSFPRRRSSVRGGLRPPAAILRRLVHAVGILGVLFGVVVPTCAEDLAPRHRIVLQVSVDDLASMDLALTNVDNIIRHYAAKGERVDVDLTAFGPGFRMFRADVSPFKDRIAELKRLHPFVHFSACQNARRTMAMAEGKSLEDIPELPEVEDVAAGVVHISELQEQGWSYLRP